MKLLTTLLLFCMTTFVHAQELTASQQAIAATAETVADEPGNTPAETTNIFIDYDDDDNNPNSPFYVKEN